MCVLDDDGRAVARFTIAHRADGFDRLTARLGSHGSPAGLPVAIERPDGRLVDRLRELVPFSAETRALRAVVRARTDLVEQRVAAANQLAAVLDAFWPGAKAVFADLWSPIALDFLDRYPTPTSAARLGEARMAAFLILLFGGSSVRQPTGPWWVL